MVHRGRPSAYFPRNPVVDDLDQRSAPDDVGLELKPCVVSAILRLFEDELRSDFLQKACFSEHNLDVCLGDS